jgi:cardiolipin synthase
MFERRAATEPSRRSFAAVRGHLKARLRLAAGHRITILQNGAEFFPTLIDSIDRAQVSVELETYIFNDDRSGQAVADALARAAARGVAVRLVVDGFGTVALEGRVAEVIGSSRVEVRVFRPFRTVIGMRLRVLRRLHRKLCVIDGSEAFAGGINLLDDRVDPRHGPLEAPRLDFALRVTGPLVAEVDEAMRRLWDEASEQSPSVPGARAAGPWPDLTGVSQAGAGLPQRLPGPTQGLAGPTQRLPGPTQGLAGPTQGACPVSTARYPDAPQSFDAVHAGLALRDNVRNRRTIERFYLRVLGRARREVLIASPYFLPGRRFRRALCAAARRGVRVRLLLQGRVEYRLPHLGTLALYEPLLREGVEIIEYGPSFLHAKVAIADDWVTVGSANIDPFSLLLAREANVVARSRPLAQALRERLEQAVERGGRAVELDRVEREPLWRRLAARAAWLMIRIGVAVSGSGLRY